jgi:hypothetical protein
MVCTDATLHAVRAWLVLMLLLQYSVTYRLVPMHKDASVLVLTAPGRVDVINTTTISQPSKLPPSLDPALKS